MLANRFENLILVKILLKLESLVMLFAKYVVVVSPTLKSMLTQYTNKKVIFVPNGHNMPVERFFQKFKKRDFKRFVYFGTDQPYYSFEDIVQISDLGILMFDYYGRLKNNEESRISLANHFRRPFHHGELEGILCPYEDILILPYRRGTLAEVGFPVKLSEYLTKGCLIIATDTGILGPFLGKVDQSLVYRDGDLRSLVSAIIYAKKLNEKEILCILDKYYELAVTLSWSNLAPMIVEGRDYQ